MDFSKVKIEALISADVAAVWEFWTKPEHITKWNFAADTWCCPRATNDLRVGGKFVSRMEAKDGSFGFDFEGLYNEVISLRKISYAMADGRKVSTEFERLGNKTKVTTIFDAEKENSEELQKNGWQSILNNFRLYVENKQSV